MPLALPLHGTLIQYQGLGIYITGPNGSGKSETALQLIRDGAQLVCDDAPLFQTDNAGNVLGLCPENFEGLIHIRDLGIINIAELFGQQQIKNQQQIDFIIEIDLTADYDSASTEIQYRHWQFQSCLIPGQTIKRSAGRNMALLIHIAVLMFQNSLKQQ